ncbi:hypothetical protein D3C85_1765050 [compost metagenome]
MNTMPTNATSANFHSKTNNNAVPTTMLRLAKISVENVCIIACSTAGISMVNRATISPIL